MCQVAYQVAGGPAAPRAITCLLSATKVCPASLTESEGAVLHTAEHLQVSGRDPRRRLPSGAFNLLYLTNQSMCLPIQKRWIAHSGVALSRHRMGPARGGWPRTGRIPPILG